MKKFIIVVAIGAILLAACQSSNARIAITNDPPATQIPSTVTIIPTSTVVPTPSSMPGSFPVPLGSRAVFTYYFYWYDVVSGKHTDQ
jgi:hypothetical protein